MEFLLYIVSMGCIIFISFVIGNFFKHLSGYIEKNINVKHDVNINVNHDIEPYRTPNDDMARIEDRFTDNRKIKKIVLNPVMSSEPDRDRKIHFTDSDFLVPENLTEGEKQLLEQFYGKS